MAKYDHLLPRKPAPDMTDEEWWAAKIRPYLPDDNLDWHDLSWWERHVTIPRLRWMEGGGRSPGWWLGRIDRSPWASGFMWLCILVAGYSLYLLWLLVRAIFNAQ